MRCLGVICANAQREGSYAESVILFPNRSKLVIIKSKHFTPKYMTLQKNPKLNNLTVLPNKIMKNMSS